MRIATTARRIALSAVLVTGACDGEEAPAEESEPAAVAEEPSAEAPPPIAPPAEEPIQLDNGFIPDPHVVEGTAVGASIAADSLDATCTGYIGTTPDHVLVTRGSFAELRLLLRSEDPLTLVVAHPDGSYLCGAQADDGPTVVGEFAPGRHEIWIGSPTQEDESAYLLGISELASVTPASLALAPH